MVKGLRLDACPELWAYLASVLAIGALYCLLIYKAAATKWLDELFRKFMKRAGVRV